MRTACCETASVDVRGYAAIAPLPGGHAGETFAARAVSSDGTLGDPCVLRIYGVGNRSRGPEAPDVQAGVLRLVAGLIPAPTLIEHRSERGAQHGLLVTTLLPGVQLSTALAGLAPDRATRIGTHLGEILGRLSGLALRGPGTLMDLNLTLGAYPDHAESLLAWVRQFRKGSALSQLDATTWTGVEALAARGEELLTLNPRACLVHGDLSTRNVLCDPEGGRVTGVVDWEFAHAGHPLEDLGKLLRDTRRTPLGDAAVAALIPWLPDVEQGDVTQVAERARAADLYWIVEAASRRGQTPATIRAFDLLVALARAGDLLGEPTAVADR